MTNIAQMILRKVKTVFLRVNKVYVLLYLMSLIFCMRWDILYARSIKEIFVKRLPLELLCLLLGIGLACIISFYVTKTAYKYAKSSISVAYFAILYLVLTNTGILWNRHTDLNTLMAFAVIIALLRIIEKNHVGVFAENNKQYLRKVLYLLFAFFFVIDLAYKPPAKEKKASIQPQTNTAAETIFADNAEKLKSLQADKWSKLSTEERLDILQIVVNIEINHLGLTQTIAVKSAPLGKSYNACYTPKKYTVYVNEKRLEYAEPYEMLTSVAHESYHAYQQRMVEVYKSAGDDVKKLLAFRKWAKYNDEMKSYVDGKADYEGYYTQTMEADAREYGKKRTKHYCEKLKLK